jgi:hypothetical protein
MPDITITIPLELTVSQIVRANSTLGDEEARELAQEVHSIIDMVQAACAAHPPDKATLTARLPGAAGCLPYETAVAYELGDVIDSIRNTIFGFWPTDSSEGANLSIWIAKWLAEIDASNILYARYMHVHDRVQGTDFSKDLTVEEDGPALRH